MAITTEGYHSGSEVPHLVAVTTEGYQRASEVPHFVRDLPLRLLQWIRGSPADEVVTQTAYLEGVVLVPQQS